MSSRRARSQAKRSPREKKTDSDPILNAIVRTAARLCDASHCHLYLVDGGFLRNVAKHGSLPHSVAVGGGFPIGRGSVAGRAVHDRRTVHVRDLKTVAPREFKDAVSVQRAVGLRTMLATPLLRDGQAIGSLVVLRRVVRPFTAHQIALLKSFAEQATIALENARLSRELAARNSELTEALGRETATGEILGVISRSPTDIQPVLSAVAESAARLCHAYDVTVFRVEGDVLRLVAHHGPVPATPQLMLPVSRDTVGGRTVVEARTIQVADAQLDDGEFPLAVPFARQFGHRTLLSVPLMRESVPIGVIQLRRTEVAPFTDAQIALLQTFADQAVIAIENVRLFTELEKRNRELTDSLTQQTATAEILRVISSSPTDIQPVLEAVTASSARLCEVPDAAIFLVDGQELRLATHLGPIALGPVGEFTVPVRGSLTGRVALERRTIQLADHQAEEGEYPEGTAVARRLGVRTMLTVPLLRSGEAIGVIALRRTEIRLFTDAQIALLQTFADQAVIAIENVRLFTELQARTAELTRSVGQLTALGEISRAVSSTLDVETVLQTVVWRASQLANCDGGAIYEYDDATQEFHIRATHNLDPAMVAALRASPLHRGEGAMGRAAETREPVQITDIQVAGAYRSHIRDTLLRAGYRALLSVPLLREGQIIGSLSLNRKTPGEFSAEAVEVLKTFATQSALAIQNARLFGEIEVKSRQLEAASQHKSEFLANMSHELRTPLNAIIGFSEVLNERMFGDLNEKQDEYLKDIHASGTHLLSLINDILDLSKIEAGRMELELTDFHLPSAIDSALTLVRERATRRGITLAPAVDGGVGPLRADERKVRQVLLNLLSNAIKFTPEGGRIEVRAARENGAVEVSVSDTGIGIAPEDREAVFEEFRQVGSSAARQQGTGLGLTLCRKFIELHGGKIWVTSALGAGSTFTFRLPIRQV
jgi:signal transduction histidine kinase